MNDSDKILYRKLRKVKDAVERARGKWDFFGLFQRENSQGSWDVVVSAPWAKNRRHELISAVAKQLMHDLKPDEMAHLYRVATVRPEDLPREIRLSHSNGVKEFKGFRVQNVEVDRAVVFPRSRLRRMVSPKALRSVKVAVHAN